MKYQIDQSGKIEQTNIKTVVAICNGEDLAIVLNSSDKKLIQNIFRQTKHAKNFPFVVFAALLALLIKKVNPKNKILVDEEYTGQEKLITEKYVNFMRCLKAKSIPQIEFGHVGKSAKVHRFGYLVWLGKNKKSFSVKLTSILELIFEHKNDRNLNASRPRSV